VCAHSEITVGVCSSRSGGERGYGGRGGGEAAGVAPAPPRGSGRGGWLRASQWFAPCGSALLLRLQALVKNEALVRGLPLWAASPRRGTSATFTSPTEKRTRVATRTNTAMRLVTREHSSK